MPKVDTMSATFGEDYNLNTLDVTESVRVSDPDSVKSEVLSIYSLNFPCADTTRLENAFDLFAQLYQGRFPGYHPCDTLYHDTQHSLDIALTTTRLLRGYHKVHGILTDDQVLLGIVTALFHDSGYVRKLDDSEHANGAEYTGTHVSRGVEFMLEHLPAIGLQDIAQRSAQIVHLTGYEVKPQAVEPEQAADRLIGDIVATADLITQMADRCYLEKCRDRLFPELTLAAESDKRKPSPIPVYRSAEDLLCSTPSFYRLHVRKRIVTLLRISTAQTTISRVSRKISATWKNSSTGGSSNCCGVHCRPITPKQCSPSTGWKFCSVRKTCCGARHGKCGTVSCLCAVTETPVLQTSQ